ncbi:hypothetical protein HY374_00790 [Candidatus Berkelbacteria bacterium]|nr:hypothetical protein [Candidatus Berkelbacteria bacterium]
MKKVTSLVVYGESDEQVRPIVEHLNAIGLDPLVDTDPCDFRARLPAIRVNGHEYLGDGVWRKLAELESETE